MTKKKKYAILVPLTLVFLVGAWQGLRFAWLHFSASVGTRTGVIRKMSVKGSPLCRYLAGEMILIGGMPGQAPEVWDFTVLDHSDTNPVVQKLHEAEKSAKQVTVDYRDDRSRWWACSPVNYFVTNVE